MKKKIFRVRFSGRPRHGDTVPFEKQIPTIQSLHKSVGSAFLKIDDFPVPNGLEKVGDSLYKVDVEHIDQIYEEWLRYGNWVMFFFVNSNTLLHDMNVTDGALSSALIIDSFFDNEEWSILWDHKEISFSELEQMFDW